MSDTLELTASDAIMQARYLRVIANALERLGEEVYVKQFPHLLPTTASEAWPFTQIRVTSDSRLRSGSE